jgi:hypothetical protein
MISSLVIPEIQYKESKTIEDDDDNHESEIYEIELNDVPVEIVLGKKKIKKDKEKKKSLAYWPIYLLSKKKAGRMHSKIGVFEIPQEKELSAVDEDGSLLLGEMDHVLFSFVTEEYLEPHRVDISKDVEEIKPKTKKPPVVEPEEEPDELKDMLSLKPPPSPSSSPKQKGGKSPVVKSNWFVEDKKITVPSLLDEETPEISEEIRNKYKDTVKHMWIQRLMKNENYRIEDVEANGDCLFAVVREAFKQIGKITTVAKLRLVVAHDVTEEQFRVRKEFYLSLVNEKNDLTTHLNQWKTEITKGQQDLKTGQKKQNKKLFDDINELIIQYNRSIQELKYNNVLLSEFVGFEDLHNLEDYRKFITTPRYWADDTAISCLEKKLKCKLIIMNEDSFENHSFDNIVQCGSNDHGSSWNPEHYIMTSLSNEHYKNISYYGKKILKFSEIPYDVKILILQKCMERNAGAFYNIVDFVEFKNSFDLEEDTKQNVVDLIGASHDYDTDTQFVFYEKSNHFPPGKGMNEKINPHSMIKYANLYGVWDWRMKLDDTWFCTTGLFKLDNHKWGSVSHYVWGCQFKKEPDIYLQFCLESRSDISQSVEKARNAVLHFIQHGTLVVNHVTTSYNHALVPTTQDRVVALREKFRQNEDLKNMLLFTDKALLMHFERRSVPEIDLPLMKCRSQLREKEIKEKQK